MSLISLKQQHKALEQKFLENGVSDCHDHDINVQNAKEILHVIIVVSNPVNFARRYQLFEEFVHRYENHPQIRLYSTELQQGTKPYKTSAKYKYRTNHEIWHKENLINLTVRKLDKNWTKMAWIDADITFLNDNWVQDTLDALDHYKVVQMFQNAIDMGPNGEVLNVFTGIGYAHCCGKQINGYGREYSKNFYHPGYAYAINRRAYNKIGGLLEFAILGSADSHMAFAFLNIAEQTLNPDLHENYKTLIRIFQERCKQYINKNFGYVKGTIYHDFHGKKKCRQYNSRWKILINHGYDPLKDIYYDAQGLLQLTNQKPNFRDDLRRYFRARNEDSIDV